MTLNSQREQSHNISRLLTQLVTTRTAVLRLLHSRQAAYSMSEIRTTGGAPLQTLWITQKPTTTR